MPNGRVSPRTRRARKPAWTGGKTLVVTNWNPAIADAMSFPPLREQIGLHLQWRAHVASHLDMAVFFADMMESYDDDVAVILSDAGDAIYENRLYMPREMIP